MTRADEQTRIVSTPSIGDREEATKALSALGLAIATRGVETRPATEVDLLSTFSLALDPDDLQTGIERIREATGWALVTENLLPLHYDFELPAADRLPTLNSQVDPAKGQLFYTPERDFHRVVFLSPGQVAALTDRGWKFSLPTDTVRLGSIAFSAEGVAEMDRDHRAVFIPRDQLRGLKLAYGSGAEQPIVVLVLALVALALSLYPIAEVVNWLREGGILQGEIVWLCALSPLAAWLFHLALKRRFILKARMVRGSRKLIFGRDADPAEIEPFLTGVASRFGYTIDVDASARDQRMSPQRG